MRHYHIKGEHVGSFIVPMGITTFVLLLGTALTGWFMPKNRKVLFKVHRILALLTIIAAMAHASLIIFGGY